MPLVRLIGFWATHSGEEWTVQRLKDLRQLYLHDVAGLPYVCETRIALDSRGHPQGPFSVFFTKRRKGSRWFAKSWSALMVYTGFVSAKVTPGQTRKFLTGVRREAPTTEGLCPAMDMVSLGVRDVQWRPRPPAPKGDDILDFVPREAKERSVLRNRTPEVNSILAEATNLMRFLGTLGEVPDIVRGTLESVMLPRHHFLLRSKEYGGKPVIGHVSAVQEPGYKARFVASPYPAVQQMFRPLHNWMADVNRHLVGNYQFDQAAGLQFVQDKLRQTGYAASVDLSGYTDNFPLKLQTLA